MPSPTKTCSPTAPEPSATGSTPAPDLQITHSWRMDGAKQYMVAYQDPDTGQGTYKLLVAGAKTDRQRGSELRQDQWLEEAINWAYRMGRESAIATVRTGGDWMDPDSICMACGHTLDDHRRSPRGAEGCNCGGFEDCDEEEDEDDDVY